MAYCDAGLQPKAAALTTAGFRCSATLKQRVAADQAQTAWVDVEVWEKFAVELPNEETRDVTL